jgi:hypothetical protein
MSQEILDDTLSTSVIPIRTIPLNIIEGTILIANAISVVYFIGTLGITLSIWKFLLVATFSISSVFSTLLILQWAAFMTATNSPKKIRAFDSLSNKWILSISFIAFLWTLIGGFIYLTDYGDPIQWTKLSDLTPLLLVIILGPLQFVYLQRIAYKYNQIIEYSSKS